MNRIIHNEEYFDIDNYQISDNLIYQNLFIFSKNAEYLIFVIKNGPILNSINIFDLMSLIINKIILQAVIIVLL